MDGNADRKFDDVINLMQMFPSPLGNDDGINRFFLETQKIFDCDELVFLHPADGHAAGIDIAHSFSLRGNTSFLSRYADYFWRFDPLYPAELGSESILRAFRTEDVMPIGSFVKQKYYYDFLQPQGLLSELVIRIYFKSYFMGAISLLRSKQRPVFDEDDVRKAELLIPYIANTIDVGDIFTKNLYEKQLCEQWLESLPEGIILLGNDLRTLYRNSKAAIFCMMMGRKSGMSEDIDLSGIPVPDVVIQDCTRLARSAGSNGGNPGYDNRIVNAGARNRYHVQYFTFPALNADTMKPGFIVVMNDLSRYNTTESIMVNQVKLSNREAVVARYAGMGWTNKEIADSIHSSPFTIQNQLKSVFEKTGLKNRTQLASLMKYLESIPIE